MAQNLDRLKDVMPDILSRLLVKSLRRFACVNKSWCHLIKSPDFISKHLCAFNNHMNLTDPFNLLVSHAISVLSSLSGHAKHPFLSVVHLLSFNPATNTISHNLSDLIYNHDDGIFPFGYFGSLQWFILP